MSPGFRRPCLENQSNPVLTSDLYTHVHTPTNTYLYHTQYTHAYIYTKKEETKGREERKASKQMGPGKAGNQVHPSAITTAAVTAAKTVVTTSAPGYSIALTLHPGFTLCMARVPRGAYDQLVRPVPFGLW